MESTARRAATATLVALSIVVAALALWKIKAVIALIFLGFTISAAMRPGVEWLHRRARVPRGLGVLVHYVALLGLVAIALWLFVPRAVSQVDQAIGSVPTSSTQLRHQAANSSGIKREILLGIQKRLGKLPSASSIVHSAVSVTSTAFEVLIGIFFMFAVGAYWIFERDRGIALVQSLVPRRHRRVTRDTWLLIDDKLGAFVRGELILVVFVASVLSLAFWLDGLPYWLLIGVAAGVFEIVPVIGPLVAGVLAVGVGLTVDWQTALGAGIAVLVLRQLEDLLRRAARARPRGRPLPSRRARLGDGDRDPLRRLLRPARDPHRGGARDARRRRPARRRPGGGGGSGAPLRGEGRRELTSAARDGTGTKLPASRHHARSPRT